MQILGSEVTALHNHNLSNRTADDNRSLSHRIAFLGLLSAFAIIISYIEALIPIPIGIPGIKPGLANIVIVMMLYTFGVKEALIINFIRIIVIGIMFGNIMSVTFSVAGALLSLIAMWLVKKLPGISIVGVSICGGVSHNIGQIMIAIFLTNTFSLTYYVPFLIIGGIITGILIGIIANIIYNRLKTRLEDI